MLKILASLEENKMELEAKEHRFVIMGLKKLLQETTEKINTLPENDDERIHLSNDAMLIDTMINGFEGEYKRKYEK